MSKIEVDKVDPQSGTALEIGTSGDTVTVPSGVGLTLTDSTLLLPTTINTDKIDPKSGTALEIGTSGDTITVPTGAGLTVTDEVKTNKISPATGVAFALGDSGDTFTVPAGATIVNSGTATGFGGGKVLQVVQTVETGTSTLSSSSFVDLGISVDITPASSSNKVLVIASLDVGGDGGGRGAIRLLRDTTDILLADADGSRTRASVAATNASNAYTVHPNITYLDSPSSTSALTYKIQGSIEGGNSMYLNRSLTNTDSADFYRGTSTLTVMEISG